MIPGFERNLHPRVTADYVYNAMSEQWMSLDDITERCGITISERHVVSRRLNELVKTGLVIRHFDRAGAGRTNGSRNTHPTVKPTALMRYLCRLITPPNGIILDPFAGSGSTGVAASLEGFNCVLIEIEHNSADIARARNTPSQGDASTHKLPDFWESGWV